MAVEVTCDECADVIGLVEEIACQKCRAKCSACGKVGGKVWCDGCGEKEFSTLEPNTDDLITSIVDEDDLRRLSAAIRAGDRDEAEYRLDKIAAEVGGWTEIVEAARYTRAARPAA